MMEKTASGQPEPQTILVVEDNPMNRELVHDLLVFAGFKVLEAMDASECRARLQASQPDLILMDIQLPEVDGYTLAKELKADEKTCRIPIVALTAYAMQGDREKALDAGCVSFIAKPINTKMFIAEIKKQLPPAA